MYQFKLRVKGHNRAICFYGGNISQGSKYDHTQYEFLEILQTDKVIIDCADLQCAPAVIKNVVKHIGITGEMPDIKFINNEFGNYIKKELKIYE